MAKIDRKRLRAASFALLGAVTIALGSASAAADRPAPSHQPTFREFIDALWPLAEKRGVSRPTFNAAFAGVSFDPQVVANAQSQPEFVRPIWDYIASALSPDRVERGRERARSESFWLARAKETFGVDDAALLGIWGLETDFGGFVGSNNVIQALASLAYVHFQGDYFRNELLRR